MIPPWKDGLLPPGIHWAAWEEIVERYGTNGECFPNVSEAATGSPFLEFFQTRRDTGEPKGIVAIDLEYLS